MEKNKVNVLCVDDHTLFRKGTAMLLGSMDEVQEVYEAENGLEAIKHCGSLDIDVVLMDLDMPVMNGVEASKKIVVKYPNIKIIVISQHDRLAVISEMIEIGVHSYLLKQASPDEVNKAILSVINDEFYYNHLVAKALRHKVQKDAVNSPLFKDKSSLTKREVEILQLICEELTMREIGERLFVSEQTIQTHRKNLMKKINVHSGVGLVKYAIQNSIVSI